MMVAQACAAPTPHAGTPHILGRRHNWRLGLGFEREGWWLAPHAHAGTHHAAALPDQLRVEDQVGEGLQQRAQRLLLAAQLAGAQQQPQLRGHLRAARPRASDAAPSDAAARAWETRGAGPEAGTEPRRYVAPDCWGRRADACVMHARRARGLGERSPRFRARSEPFRSCRCAPSCCCTSRSVRPRSPGLAARSAGRQPGPSAAPQRAGRGLAPAPPRSKPEEQDAPRPACPGPPPRAASAAARPAA